MRKNRYTIDRSSLDSLSSSLLEKLKREKLYMLPFFSLKDDKKVFLKTLEILYNDINSDYTIFIAKPGAFKTSKQEEENGLNYSPFENNAFTVGDYRSYKTHFDFFGIEMRELFYNKKYFDTLYAFYEENFEKLKFNYLKK